MSLHLALDRETCLETFGELEGLVRLSVSLRDPMLKRRKIIHELTLSQEHPESLAIPQDEIAQFSHGREIFIRLHIFLGSDVPKRQAGFPHYSGQWIARRIFHLKIPTVLGAFNIQPMSPEAAFSLTGYRGALVHVDYSPMSLVEDADSERPVADCFVAEAVFEAAETARRPELSDLLMSEIISQILWEARMDIADAKVVRKDSPLNAVIEQLSKGREFDLAELKKVLKDPFTLRAAVQDRLGVVDSLGAIT